MTNELILKFLKNNYPIKRIRYGRTFKNGVIFNETTKHFIDNDSSFNSVKLKLYSILILVFDFDEKTTSSSLDYFLKPYTYKLSNS